MLTLKTIAPPGATHYWISNSASEAGGYNRIHVRWFKKTNASWFIYETDNDNEYPEWRMVQDYLINRRLVIPLS